MQAERVEIASERRTHRRSHGEKRDHAAAGIDRRREPGLSFTQDARMRRAYGKCRLNDREATITIARPMLSTAAFTGRIDCRQGNCVRLS